MSTNTNNIIIEDTVKIGKNVKILPNNVILGNTIIGDNSIINYGNYINNSTIGKNCNIEYSHIEESVIEDFVSIGPFSHLRPNSKIGSYCKIGNFVEIKNSQLGNNVKASHLSYIGDAEIGNNCNIGCGVIFANYNGTTKNKSIVKDNCFIGSNVNIIAPITLANGTYICAGTTITRDTNEYDFVIGRPHETIKSKKAKYYIKNF